MMTTNELSDNIGTEFATAVPGALFQVSGRRLSDRRFYVDIVMFPGPECVALPEPVPGVEIISGPEAEELLATVEGWIGTDRAGPPTLPRGAGAIRVRCWRVYGRHNDARWKTRNLIQVAETIASGFSPMSWGRWLRIVQQNQVGWWDIKIFRGTTSWSRSCLGPANLLLSCCFH